MQNEERTKNWRSPMQACKPVADRAFTDFSYNIPFFDSDAASSAYKMISGRMVSPRSLGESGRIVSINRMACASVRSKRKKRAVPRTQTARNKRTSWRIGNIQWLGGMIVRDPARSSQSRHFEDLARGFRKPPYTSFNRVMKPWLRYSIICFRFSLQNFWFQFRLEFSSFIENFTFVLHYVTVFISSRNSFFFNLQRRVPMIMKNCESFKLI